MVRMFAAAGESNTVIPAEIITALQEGCGKVATGVTEAVVAVLPLGLGVFGLLYGIRIATNFFRSLAHA